MSVCRADASEDPSWSDAFSEYIIKAYSSLLVERNVYRDARRVVFPFEIGIHVFTMIRAILHDNYG